jgi:PAS domain S-box-containing protein
MDIDESSKVKKREGHLKKKSRLMEIILNSLDEGIVITDGQGQIEKINPVAQELTGWTHSRAQGESVEKVFHISDSESKARFDKVLMEGKEIDHSGTTVLMSKNQKEYQIIYSAYPIQNRYGIINGMVIIIRNNRESYELKKSLEKLKNRHYLLYESMHEGVCIFKMVYDEEGRAIDYIMLDANPNYEKILGLKKEKHVGQLASEFFDSDNPKYMETFARVVENKQPAFFETYSKKIGGYFQVSAFSPEEEQFMVIFSDITETIKLEQEKKLLKKQLIESKKLESRGFIALMILVFLQIMTAYLNII